MIGPLAAPPPPPPAIVQPAPREASFGRVQGTVPAGTRRIVVRVDGRVVADRPLRGRTFDLRVELPLRELRVGVTALGPRGSSRAAVRGVRGLPGSALGAPRAARVDPALARRIRALASSFPGIAGVFVQDVRGGRGASANAAARFPAASTLKLAIAVTVLRRHDGKPAPGSAVDTLLRRMLQHSDNEAANALEVWLGGSTSGGSGLVDATMWSLGMRDSLMYGGYETNGIPERREREPSFVGKRTTAADLARLARAVLDTAAGRPRLAGFDRAEARYLLWALGGSADRGKLDRFLGGRAAVLHKAGWLPSVRHDAGLVFHRDGVFVAAVLTWGGSAAAADVLAGRVAAEALARFRRD